MPMVSGTPHWKAIFVARHQTGFVQTETNLVKGLDEDEKIVH
jgi:hypothetical protein